MGGQTATPDGAPARHARVQRRRRARYGGTHSDRALGNALARAPAGRSTRHGLAVKIMQTYNTFTVGGALSVNAHGRYIGQGPLVRSVRAITLVLPTAASSRASPTENPELFYGAIGGYGALGVVADVTLDLAENTHVRRDDGTMPRRGLPRRTSATNVRDDSTVVFHNADIYPPAYEHVHAVSYRHDERRRHDRRPHAAAGPGRAGMHRTAYSMISELADRQVDARARDRSGDLPRQPGHVAQLRGELRRERARAGVARATTRTCCRSTSSRSTACGVFVPRMRHDPPGAPRQRGQRLDPPRAAGSGHVPRVGADRGVRLRAVLQAAHRSRIATRGRALDARADRRGGRERRTLLPARTSRSRRARSSRAPIRARRSCSR